MPDPPETPPARPQGADGKPLPGPAQMQQILAQKRMAQQQAQVDEVVSIMRSNVEKVIERDEKLIKLDERADALENGASQFEMHMGKLKNKFWKANWKWLVGIAVMAVALVLVFYAGRHSEEDVKADPAARMSAPEEVLETEETAVAPNNVHYINDIQNNSDTNTTGNVGDNKNGTTIMDEEGATKA